MNIAHRWHRVRDWLLPPDPMPLPPWQPPALSAAALAAPTGMHPSTRTPGPGPVLTAAATQDTQPPHGRQALTMMPPLQTDWEERAWNAYKHLGTARRAVNWLANNASRCHLYIGKVSEDGVSPPEPIDAPGLAGELLDELRDHLGESALLKRMAQHVLVCGATWLAGYPAPPPPDQLVTPATPTSGNMEPPIEPEPGPGGDPRTEWAVLSRKEWMDGEGGGIRLKLPDHPRRAPDGWVSFQPDEDVVLIPIYEPDARDAHYATSEFEAALRDTDELDGLSRRVAADIKSRLIGGGVAAVAESATMPNPGASAGGNPLNADPFITAVNAAARTAIQNPDSPDATLPIWIKVADEAFAGDGPIKHLTFTTPFDDAIPVLREEARKAIAADLDIPAEIVLGVSDLNHWCVDTDTEILTSDGWKRYDELPDSAHVLTLNIGTGISEWEPLLDVNWWQVVDEPMVRLDSDRHSSVTTLNHRWPVAHHVGCVTGEHFGRRFVTTVELFGALHLICPSRVRNTDQVEPGPEDTYVKVGACTRATISYTGTIWCPTTTNGTWLARRNGHLFYTGNSAWMVDDSAVKSHLGPLMTTIVNGLTHKITWPVLRAHGETDPEDRCVWWSAAAVIQRPDRSEVTLKAKQQGVIGGKAARRELGFSEDDKPEPDETMSAPAAPGRPGEPGEQQRPVGQGGQARPGDTPNPPKPPASTPNGSSRRTAVPAG